MKTYWVVHNAFTYTYVYIYVNALWTTHVFIHNAFTLYGSFITHLRIRTYYLEEYSYSPKLALNLTLSVGSPTRTPPSPIIWGSVCVCVCVCLVEHLKSLAWVRFREMRCEVKFLFSYHSLRIYSTINTYQLSTINYQLSTINNSTIQGKK